jgi:organic hydroperoxide reductase OsmC/OhrA
MLVHGLFADELRRSPDDQSQLSNRSEEGACAMASLYSTKVTASGGRHGSIRNKDGLLDLKLALPRALGGRGDATNPEQLFAGSRSAVEGGASRTGLLRTKTEIAKWRAETAAVKPAAGELRI